MAAEILTRQAVARTNRTGESFERALKAVLETEAGMQLKELRDGPLREERAQHWQEHLRQKRAKERQKDR